MWMGYILLTQIDPSNAKSLKVCCNSMILWFHQPLKKTNFQAIELKGLEVLWKLSNFTSFYYFSGPAGIVTKDTPGSIFTSIYGKCGWVSGVLSSLIMTAFKMLLWISFSQVSAFWCLISMLPLPTLLDYVQCSPQHLWIWTQGSPDQALPVCFVHKIHNEKPCLLINLCPFEETLKIFII